MAIIDRYLYENLTYTIGTGKKPVLVDTTLVHPKIAIPKVTWEIDFGTVSEELKNAIEETIFKEPNNTGINCAVGPAYVIGKYDDGFNPIEYHLTYLFEYEYYRTFVDRPIGYTVVGTDHLLDIGITIPINQNENDPIVIIPTKTELYRKLFYKESLVKVTHIANAISKMRMKFDEVYKPLYNSPGMFIVGASDANYITCS